MFSALDSGFSVLGSSPRREHCGMFLGKTLKYYSTSLKSSAAHITAGNNPAQT